MILPSEHVSGGVWRSLNGLSVAQIGLNLMRHTHATSVKPNLLDDGIVDTLASAGAMALDNEERQLGPVDKPALAPMQPERLGRCNTDVATEMTR
jgi:hypothetical protein